MAIEQAGHNPEEAQEFANQERSAQLEHRMQDAAATIGELTRRMREQYGKIPDLDFMDMVREQETLMEQNIKDQMRLFILQHPEELQGKPPQEISDILL